MSEHNFNDIYEKLGKIEAKLDEFMRDIKRSDKRIDDLEKDLRAVERTQAKHAVIIMIAATAISTVIGYFIRMYFV